MDSSIKKCVTITQASDDLMILLSYKPFHIDDSELVLKQILLENKIFLTDERIKKIKPQPLATNVGEFNMYTHFCDVHAELLERVLKKIIQDDKKLVKTFDFISKLAEKDEIKFLFELKITDKVIEFINKYHKSYSFINLTLDDIEKININKLNNIRYNVDNENYMYDCINIIKNIKVRIRIKILSFDKSVFLRFADAFYYSGSLIINRLNRNSDFRYNLFLVIAYNFIDELNLSDDLLCNPLVLMKIAKFSHVESNSEFDPE